MSGDLTVGFIGSGKMACALANGFVKSGNVSPGNIVSSCRHPLEPCPMKDLGITVTGDNKEVVTRSQVVILAVKPYQVEAVLQEVATVATSRHLFVSIAAGIKVASLEKNLPKETRVVRTVPNLPTQVRSGMTVLTPGSRVQDGDISLVTSLMSSVGGCEEVPETQIDAVCGLSGSGPAFMFTAIEALSDGGVKMGLPRDLAMKLAAQTMIGAARMVQESGEHPAKLKDSVCSPGGTTIAGIHKLEQAGFRAALIDAVVAATERSREMGK